VIVTAQSPLDTSGVSVAPMGVLPNTVTQAALEALPVTGIAPYNAIDQVDTSVAAAPPWWVLGALAGLVFVIAAMSGGRR